MSPAFDPAAFEWSNFGPLGLGWLTTTQPTVVLTVTRPSTGQTLTLTVQGRQLAPQNLDASIMPGNLAYVRIHDFTATEGDDAGPALPFTLDDGSLLTITEGFSRGPDGEIVDGIGVPVDDAAPLPTAADLSAGKDPGLAQALAALHG